jgi:hypothetical protein
MASWAVGSHAASDGQGRAVPARVLQSDASQVRFVVDVPTPRFAPSTVLPGFERVVVDGFDAVGKPGEPPVVSRRYFIALPPTGTYAVSTRVLASEALGSHRLEPVATPVVIDGPDEMGAVLGERVDWDEATYRAWVPPDIVEPEAPAFIRRQRALVIAVNPFLYDASTHELVVATKIEVDVRIDGGRSAAVAPRAAPPADGWNDVFGRLFVNSNVAGAWRAPMREPALTADAVRMPAAGAVKIRVRDTGVHKVSAATLLAAGFPAGQPVGNLRLYRRTYSETTLSPGETDVPVYVREGAGGTAGVFDADDLVVFYGLRVREDALQGDAREQYSSINIYWLEPGAGIAMTTRTPAPGYVTADTTTAFFAATAHFETDTFFRDATPPNVNDVYYFNTGREAGPTDMPFTVGSIRPGGGLGINAELHGQRYNGSDVRTIRLSLVNSTGETELAPAYLIDEKNRQLYVSASIPAANVAVGTNQFRVSRPAGSTRSLTEVLINYLDISYGSLYRARGNVLRFNTATLAGDTSVTVTGLSSTSDFELFDITAPAAPVRCVVGAGHFTAVPGGFAFSYRENIPPAPDREFILLPVSRMVDVAASDVILDTPSDIIGGTPPGAGDLVLVVAHSSYIGQMQSWTSYRRAQGYRVILADVDDVFDEFNGGVFHARAIQRFARHFFEHADAEALVLVGDASEDQKTIHSDSAPNFVPSFMRIDAVSSPRLDEVVTTDKRFVKLPGPGGVVDDYPDMIVGRLPVGTTTELDIVLAKTFDFESPDASEFWRKRMIIVADDEYSEGSSEFAAVNRYCYRGEIGFQNGQETTAQVIENSQPAAGYDVVRFYLKDYTSTFYPPGPSPDACALATAAWSYVRQGATERLMDELNAGATLVTIQAHMNRSTVTHERLLSTESGVLLGGTGRDHLRMDNRGRPWIIFGMGCHFSDYAIFRESSNLWIANLPNGDSFAEQLLFQNDRGAVGTYGSSGFEFLGANNTYMNMMARVWFYEAPYDTMLNQTQAQWKFGQLMFLVESKLAGMSNQREPVERYHILGDPLLRIDAGPPAFDVTVDGRSVTNGEDVTSRGVSDTLQVVAEVSDENAIHDFSLEIGGVDVSDSLTVTPLTDPTLPRARKYQVSFAHVLRPDTYDIVLRAHQPDTLTVAGEFVLRVESTIEVSVNGRVVASGGAVPSAGNYRVDLAFPVFVPGSEIDVLMDDVPVIPFNLTNPSPEDSLAWIITFQKTLPAGQHALRITAGPTIEFTYQLVVSTEAGLQDVVNYPNPFRDAGTNFLFSNEVEITDGSINVYTTSGKRVRTLEIPPGSRLPGHNAVFWDGRDAAGDALANGTYLYVIKVQQRSGSATVRGKVSKLN